MATWKPKRYRSNDITAQQERLLANYLDDLDLSSVSTMDALSRAEAEYIAECLMRGGWILIPGDGGRPTNVAAHR